MSANDPKRTLWFSGSICSAEQANRWLYWVPARRQVSVRGWTRNVVGPSFERHETVRSPAVTHEYGLARPEFGKTASPECFHMHKNIGRLGTTGYKAKPA